MDEVFDRNQDGVLRCYRVLQQCIGQMLCTLITDLVDIRDSMLSVSVEK